MPIKQEPVVSNRNTTEISSGLSQFKLGQMTKLRKFERGEHFSRFFERFAKFKQITKIALDNLHLFFLQDIRNVEICRPRRVGAEELHALL